MKVKMSKTFKGQYKKLTPEQQSEVNDAIAELTASLENGYNPASLVTDPEEIAEVTKIIEKSETDGSW